MKRLVSSGSMAAEGDHALLALARAARLQYLLTIYCAEADSCGVRSAVTKTPSR
jgi:hypothetical protein